MLRNDQNEYELFTKWQVIVGNHFINNSVLRMDVRIRVTNLVRKQLSLLFVVNYLYI